MEIRNDLPGWLHRSICPALRISLTNEQKILIWEAKRVLTAHAEHRIPHFVYPNLIPVARH